MPNSVRHGAFVNIANGGCPTSATMLRHKPYANMAPQMMIRLTNCAVVLASALALAACAAAMPGYEPPSKRNQHRLSNTETVTRGLKPDGTYTLSDDELKYDCKRLMGSTQIKILQLRHHALRPAPSAASRIMSSTSDSVDRGVDKVLGKSSGPSATADDYALQRAHLEALNRALASRNCGYFDLAAELKSDRGSAMPVIIGKK